MNAFLYNNELLILKGYKRRYIQECDEVLNESSKAKGEF